MWSWRGRKVKELEDRVAKLEGILKDNVVLIADMNKFEEVIDKSINKSVSSSGILRKIIQDEIKKAKDNEIPHKN